MTIAHSKLFNISTSPELLARFDKACDLKGLNRSEVIRGFMSDFADAQDAKTTEIEK